jgi:uncharacterized membrane protein
MEREGQANRILGLAFVVLAIGFTAVVAYPELRINRAPLNDEVLHLPASERLAGSLGHDAFLDPWVSEWALGYPVWRSYQPLPHLTIGLLMRATQHLADDATVFSFFQYLLLVLVPLSAFVGARRFGLRPAAAGLAALLMCAPSEADHFGGFGLGWGAYMWRGSGLYTQLFALHLLLLTVGFVVRALDEGRGRVATAILLATTALSHIVFAYIGFVSAALLALVGAAGERARRLARLPTLVVPALVLIAWFVIPLARVGAEIDHNRWEDTFKWDSFGAPTILRALASGNLFDFGRFPSLTLLVAVGAVVAIARLRDATARRLLVLTGAWLALFFGRETWGDLMTLAGVPGDFHLHRLQGAFEIFALWLAAWGVEEAMVRLAAWRRPAALVAALLVVAALIPVARERVAYGAQNREWGDENLAAWKAQRGDWEAALRDIQGVLAERPGRVSAGLAGGWGRLFTIGSTPIFALLSRAHLDHPSMLYHSMSLSSDTMVLRNDDSLVDDTLFGVRVLVAPTGKRVPEWAKLRGQHGRISVYAASSEGYFGLVDPVARYLGPPRTRYDVDRAWMQSPLPSFGQVLLLDERGPALPSVGQWSPLPAPVSLPHAGRVLEETKSGETYRARFALTRSSWALVKITWFPDLVATVDGRVVPMLRASPGFGVVELSPGEHEVVVEYRPGPLKPILFAGGLVLFVGLAWALRRPRAALVENQLTARLERLGTRLTSPRIVAPLALVAVLVVALHPLFRGKLIGGHDATEYPPRLVEMKRVLGDAHLPPIWAPDLGNGHGQPLFEFAPPLIYFVALPFRLVGARTADALQLGLAGLFLAGALALFALGRRVGASRFASACVASSWLFFPYLALDLFVRSAFAESSALAAAPIALYGLVAVCDRGAAIDFVFGVVGVALVCLGHNAAALLLLPAFGAFVVVRAWLAERRVRTLLGGASVLASGLLVSAYFWLPALIEKRFTKVHLLREDALRWSEHAIAPWQLFSSSWGYGFSVAGTDDGMSFQLGWIHLLIGIGGAWLALRSRDANRRALVLAGIVLTLAGAFLATSWSAPIWSRVETLQYLAYPWRALLLPALFLPVLSLAAFERLSRPLALVVAAAIVLANLAHTEPAQYLSYDDEFYQPERIAQNGINTTTREEYEPITVAIRPPYRAEPLVGLDAPLVTLSGELRSVRERFTVRAAAPTRVESHLFDYPGWRATVDGRAVAVETAPSTGLIRVALPAGEHQLELALEPTPLRRGALALSLASALGLLLGFVVVWWRKRKIRS